jgi:glycosyltransferase involved in cell wall biosynthesis
MHAPGESRKPRLLVTTSTLPRSENDPEPRFVLDLALALSEQFAITLLAPGFPGAKAQDRLFGLEVIHYRYAPIRSWERLAYPGGIMARLRAAPLNWLLVPALVLGQAMALRGLLKGRQFDLIHAHWLLPQGLIASTLPRATRPPFIATSHGGDIFILARGPLKAVLRYVMGRAAAVTAVSEELLEACRRLSGAAGERVPLQHIPMGVDTRYFATAAAEASLPADLPGAEKIILFVGRLAEKKGLDVLIDALVCPGQALSSAHLLVIGDGPLRAAWSERAASSQAGDRIHFLGSRDHRSLPAYMAAAQVLALPSVSAADGDRDGLPVTLLEAAACSLPAVASDIGGIAEFVEDGVNGLLVAPGNSEELAGALERLLTDGALRSACAAAARERARDFDWRRIADLYSGIFTAALAKDGIAAGTFCEQKNRELQDRDGGQS